ncbi:hypothetical protein NECAME_01773 [Necator americanus]|uniref:Uncharacterized protein n=1 Tax=Necator americanus TaxID=51031 RepID=W2TQR7_NECAM|nr:hypothetical protein NECAME_01773 [Necator americanus]ETN83466.1 hypothetical protein NECAME_01773 [Necator americanus]
MYFACGLGVLMVLCRDSTFVRFSIEGANVTARSALHETRLKKITSCCMHQRADLREALLLIGKVFRFSSPFRFFMCVYVCS